MRVVLEPVGLSKLAVVLASMALVACVRVGPPLKSYVPVKGERIELADASVWGGTILSVNRLGQGRFETGGSSKKTVGSFNLSPGEYEHLSELLADFRKDAVATKDQVMDTGPWCPNGHRIYDRGFIRISWVGPDHDLTYRADLGCDPELHAARNNELQDVFDWIAKPLFNKAPR